MYHNCKLQNARWQHLILRVAPSSSHIRNYFDWWPKKMPNNNNNNNNNNNFTTSRTRYSR